MVCPWLINIVLIYVLLLAKGAAGGVKQINDTSGVEGGGASPITDLHHFPHHFLQRVLRPLLYLYYLFVQCEEGILHSYGPIT